MKNRIISGIKVFTGIAALIALALALNYVVPLLRGDSFHSTPGAGMSNSDLIAFVSNRGGNNDIYIIKADGSGLTDLTNNPANDEYPTWSPDGNYIAFVSNRDGNDNIYVMNSDGSNLTRLTDDPASDSGPAWSPDGKKIAYSSGDLDKMNTNIYIMDADGKNQHSVTGYIPYTRVWPNSWSPDGKWISFELYRQIVQVGVNGGNVKPITPQTDENGPINFIWTKDGSTLMYITVCSDTPSCYMLHSIHADGSNATTLAKWQTSEPCPLKQTPTWMGEWIKWSPDRTKILFVFTCEETGWLYIANADGSDFRSLTNYSVLGNGPSETPLTGDWSPDNQSIVFISALGLAEKTNLYALNVRDALKDPSIRPTPLTNTIEIASWPAWQPRP